jgi:nucleotide-binding universal stress UspA family protein
MSTSIICGSDLSEGSGRALAVAVALAELRGERSILLVHVVDPDLADRERAVQDARARLDAQVAELPQRVTSRVVVRGDILVGPAADTLVALADTEHAELLVIAACSTPASLLRLGTTTAQVVTRATVPVLAVRDHEPFLAMLRGTRPLRLLVGIDDSATADLGVQWTHALRKLGPVDATGGVAAHPLVDVVLGAIYYPDDAASYYGLEARNLVDRDPEIEQLMSRDLLRRFRDTRHVVARPRRGLGRIGDHMIELAREEQVDAIVVGTSQKTGLGRLGSVSSVIVNDAPQSVICIPPQADIPTLIVPAMKTAVVATDLSAFANRAIAYAFAVVDPDAEVHIVHVAKDDDVDQGALSQQLHALAPPGTTQRVVAHVLHGDDPAEMIAPCAARLGADVICIASHGRSGLTRALVGSVADRLLRATRLPVLVLRPA